MFWILDLDTLIKEKREIKIGEKSKIQEFKEYVIKLKNIDSVVVLVNTPCLEYWFLLHFKDKGKYHSSCESVVAELKKNDLVKDYKKTRDYFLNIIMISIKN